MNTPDRFSELWNDYLEGELSAEGHAELRTLLAADPTLEKLAVDLYQLHRSLGYTATAEVSAEAFVADTLKRIRLANTDFVPRVLDRIIEDTPRERPHPSTWTWFNSMIRPLAAGLLIGGLSASMVWAYTAPVAVTRLLSFHELGCSDFSSTIGDVRRGFPIQAGNWGGDAADFIEPKLIPGVVNLPDRQSKPWLRFIRTGADREGRPANSCDVFQIIDLRNILPTTQGLDTTIEFSAQFADRSPHDAPQTKVGCQIYFFRSSPETFAQDWPAHVSEAASFTGKHIPIPRSKTDFLWTAVSVKATPPPDALFAVIQLSAQMPSIHPFEEKALGNHFVASANLILKTQPALPVRPLKKP